MPKNAAKENTKNAAKDLGFVIEKNDNYFTTDRGLKGFCKDRFVIGSKVVLLNGDCKVVEKTKQETKKTETNADEKETTETKSNEETQQDFNLLEGGENV